MADNQPVPSVPRTDQNANDDQRHPTSEVPPAVASDMKIPPSHPSYQISCETKRDGWDYAKLWAEFIGLGFLIVYTLATIGYVCITHRQWKEMQKQTRVQSNAAMNSERAWVGLGMPITLEAIEMHSGKIRIRGHYSVQNFGHGPALKVIQSGNFAIPNQTLEVEGREANFFCDSSVRFATGTIPVGGEAKEPPPFGHTLFPGQVDNESIDYQGLPETVTHLRFIGCVAYIDQFKTVHWTRFCMERNPGDPAPIPTLAFCAMYNDTDRPED